MRDRIVFDFYAELPQIKWRKITIENDVQMKLKMCCFKNNFRTKNLSTRVLLITNTTDGSSN